VPASGALAATDPELAPAALKRWIPKRGLSWQIQYAGTISTAPRVSVYNLDSSVPTSVVTRLHKLGRKVICYISAGSWEPYRADRRAFPKAVIGKAQRMDVCRAKGFDAVDPDNVDGYTNNTGFKLTAAHQLAYNIMIAKLAHQRGLAVGLKNDVDQVARLAPYFDFAVNEQCLQYDECGVYSTFTRRGKPVFHVEYVDDGARRAAVCSATRGLGFSTVVKRLDLDAWRQTC
jgi:hypothetical protein